MSNILGIEKSVLVVFLASIGYNEKAVSTMGIQESMCQYDFPPKE